MARSMVAMVAGATLVCGRPDTPPQTTGGAQHNRAPGDSLVLTNPAGVQIWFTLARSATSADGRRCVERGLEIRRGANRVKVPLLYTGAPPVLLNDSTMRAILWTHCKAGEAYWVNLGTGHPVPDRAGGPR